MGKIITNERLNEDFFLLKAEAGEAAEKAFPGQFCMLRAGEEYPLLSRPISIFDADPASGTLSFLYKTVGKGTDIISRMKPGDELELRGPFGHGFPVHMTGRTALVGGGVGIAPLYLLAKRLAERKAASDTAADGLTVDVYLGFSGTPALKEEYGAVCDALTVNIGGFVTDDVDPAAYDTVITCGPEIMMRVLYRKCLARGAGDRLWVSMEKRMACGIGICKVCTCFTADGTKTACKDGPVFRAAEVFYDETAPGAEQEAGS